MEQLVETSVDTGIEIIVGDASKRIRLLAFDGDDDVVPMPITDVKVYITEDETSNIVNNRDGTTNIDGITIDQNQIIFLIGASDNVRIAARNNVIEEYHWVKFEAFYGDTRMKAFRFKFKIIDA